MRSILLSACVAIVALAIGAYWLDRESKETDAVASSPGDVVGLRWRTGTEQRHALWMSSSMSMRANDRLTAPDLEVLVEATVELRTLESGGDGALVGFRLSAVDMTVAGESDPRLDAALEEPFRVRFVSGGVPESFEFPASMLAEHRSMIENLVRAFQVSLRPGEEWRVREANAMGRHEAIYRRTTPTRVSKSKRDFVGSPTQPMFVDASITSDEVVEFDASSDWIAAMDSSETLTTTGRGGPVLTIDNRARLTLLSTTGIESDPDVWAFDAAAPPSPVDTARTAPDLSPEEARRRLLAELDTLDGAAEGRIVMIHRLRDLLGVDGSQPGILLDAMRTRELTDRTRADLYLALELAGTPPAQAALVSVTRDPSWSSRDAARAIVALGGVEAPTPETLSALWDLTQDARADDEYRLKGTALFALGSLGKAMRDTGASDYADIATRLMDGAMAGVSAGERADYVHALGNTRDASLATSVVVLLQDEAAAVRLAAAQTLGSMGADPVAEELMARLPNEANGPVRGAIAEALTRWSTPSRDAMEAVGAMVQTERDENARLNMARFLGANLADFPENERILRRLLRVEPSKHIRQNIAEALAANG